VAVIATINIDLQRIIRTIPGYDPFAQAGDFTFDEIAAQFAIDFIQECCRHVKGPKGGQQLVLEPWQKAVVANLWGWKRPDGTRRFREALVYIPRGNSKTTLAAAFVCLELFTNKEPGAELYSAAAERDQARLCFEVVAGMIRQEAELSKRAQVYKYSIVVDDRSYKAISADAGTKHGFNVQFLVNDELHAQRTPELTEVLMTGMGKRTQPLCIHLTTADYERENSVCNQKHDYAKRVAANSLDANSGINDPSFLPVIYEAALEDDWTDEKTWAKANPNLGVSVPLDYLKRECKRAQDDLAYRPTFHRLHLNIRTRQRNAAIAPEKWMACGRVFDEEDLAGRECGAGLDLSAKLDLTAFVMCFPEADGTFKLLSRFWIPRETALKAERDDRIPYAAWQALGQVKLTDGQSVDYSVVEADILADCKRFQVERLYYDPWNANATRTRLEDHRVTMVEFSQNLRQFNEPTKEFLKLIIEGKLHYKINGALTWCAHNMQVYTDASGNIRPTKPSEGECGKIDGCVAAIMALDAAMKLERSIYEDRGVLML
jgi:phage terminase large subunit-like protein